MIAAGRSAARAMRAPLRAGCALMPYRLSRLVRLWLSMGCPGTRPGNSQRGASGPWWIMSRVGGRSASSLMMSVAMLKSPLVARKSPRSLAGVEVSSGIIEGEDGKRIGTRIAPVNDPTNGQTYRSDGGTRMVRVPEGSSDT
jgi:hypothetical protein